MADVRARLAAPAPVPPAVLDALTEHGKAIGATRQAVGCLTRIVVAIGVVVAGVILYLVLT